MGFDEMQREIPSDVVRLSAYFCVVVIEQWAARLSPLSGMILVRTTYVRLWSNNTILSCQRAFSFGITARFRPLAGPRQAAQDEGYLDM